MKKNLAILLTMVVATTLLFNMCTASPKYGEGTFVEISTDYGDITIKLYDETPKHRDNFVKLVNEGWYNESIFHRIIKDFMIQGGGATDGKNDPDYRVDAEILPQLFHKKGVLAAARQGDGVNPERASSSCQFYIVQGKVFSDSELTAAEDRAGRPITEEQKEVYKTIGGTPHLDGAYTVFGEIVKGLDVVDKIAAVETAKGDRPVKEIKMAVKIVR
ncbi:MAG: peptidylprolyl isomerase [Bacteroidetes bacterium]|nr:peptidylprolyl isomerase [Bacteroidota bacterium]